MAIAFVVVESSPGVWSAVRLDAPMLGSSRAEGMSWINTALLNVSVSGMSNVYRHDLRSFEEAVEWIKTDDAERRLATSVPVPVGTAPVKK